jgi:cob(I)alamin adenosyltransferase
MKIYTKTGDSGQTGLLGGIRVSKARTLVSDASLDGLLNQIQHELFAIGADLASSGGGNSRGSVGAKQIERLELRIDEAEASLPPLKQFIFPGGSPVAAALHVCRSVCRRAERRVVNLVEVPSESVASDIVVYLNRLSDLLFVLARAANQSAGTGDQLWQGLEANP